MSVRPSVRPSVCLSAGGRVEVAEEGDDDDAGGGDAEHGERGRHDGERAVPLHVLLAEPPAATPDTALSRHDTSSAD